MICSAAEFGIILGARAEEMSKKTKTRLLKVLIGVTMVSIVISAVADEPTPIATSAELQAVTYDLAGIYVLANDIDISGEDWIPIGDSAAPFTGTLCGDGHKITGLCVNSATNNAGLFGVVSNATIESVSVSGTVAGNKNVGGLVGRVTGRTVISNCTAAVEVTAGEYAGGLIGYISCDHAEISGCRADGYVGGAGNVGGFVGCVGGSGTVLITNCVARGDVRSTYNNYGGFIGWANDSCATNIDCWCSGAVWGKGGNIGAFVGYSQHGTNLNCSVSLYGPGPRYFSGSQTNLPFVALAAADLSAKTNGWPKVKKHTHGATPISSAEDLRNVVTNLAGCYVLTKDIELKYQTIEPIGNAKAPFTGEFYGQNHRISGYTVNTTDPYAGLFGNIAGGRVNGVRADGSVSRSQDTNAMVAVGGFAGVIQSKSMVDDCSFIGTVSCTAGGNTGGFVGRTDDSPSILRCCAPDIWVVNNAHKPNTGGFVGNHGHGFIVDAYAYGQVEAFTNCVGGFAGYVDPAARVATSWCSCSVETQGAWLGTFVGQVFDKGLITDSYYDTTQYGDRLLAAGNGSAGGSNAYAGITPLGDLNVAANFGGFDFGTIWMMDEAAEGPILRTIFSAYELWLKDRGIADEPDPEEDVNGIPAVVRYVFGIDPDKGPDELDEPLIDVKFDANGQPSVKIPEQANTEGVTVTVLATEDISDWSNAKLIEMQYDASDGTWHPADGIDRPKMFFKWSLTIDRMEE